MGSNKAKQEQSASKKYAQQAAKASTPYDFYSKFGNLNAGPGKATYSGKLSPDATTALGTSYGKLSDITSGLPTSYDPNAEFNNPFYDTYSTLSKNQIGIRQAQDEKALNDSLTARNQLGSSYDAYAHNLMNQDYNNQYLQADQQARLGSADVYNQTIQQQLQALQGLGNQNSQLLDQYYAPAKIAMGYQSSVSPLQNSLINTYSNLAGNAQRASYNSAANYGSGMGSLIGGVGGGLLFGAPGAVVGSRVGSMLGGG